MSDTPELAQKMMVLFRGNENAYGIYKIGEPGEPDTKREGVAQTRQGHVTLDLWVRHLEGTVGLGIIPINGQNNCKWGAIDVDQYPFDHAGLLKVISELKLPLHVFRSKSGGAHVYYFLEQYIKAAAMQEQLQQFNLMLKLGAKELFPKQKTLAAGNIGNWLNMPYFGRTNRPLLRLDNKGRVIEVPLDEAVTSIHPVEEADRGSQRKADLNSCPEIIGPEAPPCLQALSLGRFPEGSRNDALFNIALLLKKRGESVNKLFEANRDLMVPPLESKEVESIWEAAHKKDFNYMCHKPPINSACNRAECLKRKWGIKDKGGMPQLVSANRLEADDETIWDLELASAMDQARTGHIRVTAADLTNQNLFRTKCVAVLNHMPVELPKAEYTAYINELIAEACVINLYGGASPRARFRELLIQFLASHLSRGDDTVPNPDLEPMNRGQSVLHKGSLYFNLARLETWLRRKDFRWRRPEILMELQSTYGAGHVHKRVRNIDVHATVLVATEENHLLDDLAAPQELEDEPQDTI